MTAIHNLYFHIPFCTRMCHYCDFAKTAHFFPKQFSEYIESLARHFKFWSETLQVGACKSIFFGGGTPSLLTAEYQPLFTLLKPYINSFTEVTLEANPLDITEANLKIWRDLGFNRISVGVQTFAKEGLTFLTRDHSPEQALSALHTAKVFFANVSADLIYGWKNQTPDQWLYDLAQISLADIQHVSCYHLMYEPRTPLGRAYIRKGEKNQSDEDSENFYKSACKVFGTDQFYHYEISNWAKIGFQSVHNKNYWRQGFFLGVGSGAHGFVPDVNSAGKRYVYSASHRNFLKNPVATLFTSEANRNADDFITEACANGLRSAEGVDIGMLEDASFGSFSPNQLVTKGLQNGLLQKVGRNLILVESEWFRENAWALEVSLSFKEQSAACKL